MLRPKLGRLWGNSNAIVRRDPGDEKYLKGWLSEIPTYQVLNFLQWKTDATIQALAERGVMEWGADVAYKQGAAVWNEADGKIYVSTLANPTDQPSSTSTQWVPSAMQITRNEYDKTVAAIDSHIADVTGNPHKLTPSRLGTYSVAQIDSLVATYRALVLAHVQDTNNPHGLTAAIIGAVPVTGGTYTGTVTMQTGQLLLSSDGKQLVKADTTGIYLKNDAGSIGVDASGKGFVKAGSAAASEIITQQTFADNKATVEANYASPAPVFYMPFIRDINIYTGGGTCDTTFEPSYDSSGRLTIPQQISVGHRLNPTDFPAIGLIEATMALDISINSPVASVQTSYCTIGIGGNGNAGSMAFNLYSLGSVRAASDGAFVDSGSVADGKVHRFVLRRTSTDISLFMDGVLVGSKDVANTAIIYYLSLIRTSAGASADQMLATNISNFRVWASALTDNQISAL